MMAKNILLDQKEKDLNRTLQPRDAKHLFIDHFIRFRPCFHKSSIDPVFQFLFYYFFVLSFFQQSYSARPVMGA